MAGIKFFGGLVFCDIVHLRLNALEHLLQHDVGNLLHLHLGELAEDDDLIQTVEELGPAGRGAGGHSRVVSFRRVL